MAKIVRTETRKRSFMGKLVKWMFIVFNLLMIVWLIAYWSKLGQMAGDLQNDAEQAGAAIGGTIGTGLLIFVWVAGDIILGLFVLFTRGKTVLIEETVE